MNINIGLNVKGDYNVKLIDSRNNEIKQEGSFHNVGCVQILKRLTGNSRSVWGCANSLMAGKGTTTPKKTDTVMSSFLWGIAASSKSCSWKNPYTLVWNCKFIFPATSAYVGNVTELGLSENTGSSFVSSSKLTTHALLTDSEGKIISFNKTDLDILEVNVVLEISLNKSNDDFNIYEYPWAFQQTLNAYIWNDHTYSAYGAYELYTYRYDTKNYRAITNDFYMDSNSRRNVKPIAGYEIDNLFNSYEEKTENYFKLKKIRIPNTSITSETYYYGIGFTGFGAISFPNENKFPTYTISGIEIGVGDGETVQFANPLNYFKKNTEVIKINDNVLTRDVDYTINNRGNHSKSFVICQDIIPEVLTDILNNNEIWKGCTTRVAPMFIPSAASQKVPSQVKVCYGINSEHPAILDYGEEQTFNFIKGYNIRLLRKAKSNGAYSTTTTTSRIYLDYSNNGEEWNELTSVQIADNKIALDFDSTTARYWRIRSDMVNSDATYDYLVAIFPSTDQIYTETCGIALGNYDPYITFTNPPADGDIITMDVGMDVIMKNGNYAMDITTQINFTLE